jgi:D-alanyl-D-alanine carboxypeptidase (penicillin-binding protein 5/6)
VRLDGVYYVGAINKSFERMYKLKKVTSVCLVLFLVLGMFAGTALAAAPAYTGEINPDIAAMLIDADSGRVLHEQRADEQVKPASTTKILTTIVALENSSLTEEVIVPPEGDWTPKISMGYSLLKIKKDEKITMKDLLYGMMLVSGDDAACAIAVHVGQKTDPQNPMTAFMNMMNAKAQEIGMTSSAFKNPGGVEEEGHYVTARDMSKLAVYAMKSPDFKEMVKTFSYDMAATNKHPAQTIENTNVLLDAEDTSYYQYATGIKTGSTRAAGGCLVASATKNGMNLICLIFNDQTKDRSDRWKIAKGLFEWGFENYTTIDVAPYLEAAGPVQVEVENYSAEDSGKGMLEFKKPEAGTTYVTLEKATANGLTNGTDKLVATPTFNAELPLQAPIKKDDVLGTVTYSSEATGEAVCTLDLIASRDIAEAGTISGETAVTTLPPTPAKKDPGQGSGSVWYWLIIPIGLIVFLIVRLITTRRSKRFKKRTRPHYSYRIK